LRKNKYEDIQMIDLEDKVDDIVEIYINRLYNTDKTVGVIANKELAEYILDNLIRLDETSIKEIDLVDYVNIDEYLVSIDDNGVITVVPIEDFGVLDKTDIFYIDMDGDISQDIIDYCVNEDKEVILFGQEDEYELVNENITGQIEKAINSFCKWKTCCDVLFNTMSIMDDSVSEIEKLNDVLRNINMN
jgi:hypothetical protein